MDSFNGKWKLVKVDNFEAYLDAIGVSGEKKSKAIGGLHPSNDITQEITVTGNGVKGKVVTPMLTKEYSAKFGESFKDTTPAGDDVTVVIKSEGGKLKETVTGKHTSNNVREIVGGKLIYTLTANGVSTVRTYEKM